jgi:hypothetical protein
MRTSPTRQPPVRSAAPTSAALSLSLEPGVEAALERLPAVAGVGQILGDGERSLVIGRPANLRRWLASHLGRAPVKKGQRPPVDLTPVARTVRFTRATSGFQQRLAFERLMARYVAPAARRDLKTPGYLHLDPAERFPRIVALSGGEGPDRFGPFRDRRAADRAREALQKQRPLRPCDFKFEPHPELPLGVGCLYAQVRTCAAPCLGRVTEDEYRGLAREVTSFLAHPAARGPEMPAWLPAFVADASARALIAEQGSAGLELYPVVAGTVDDDSAMIGVGDVEAALTAMPWREMEAPGRDAAWLTAWLYERKRPGVYSVVDEVDAAALAATLRGLSSGLPARPGG